MPVRLTARSIAGNVWAASAESDVSASILARILGLTERVARWLQTMTKSLIGPAGLEIRDSPIGTSMMRWDTTTEWTVFRERYLQLSCGTWKPGIPPALGWQNDIATS